MNFKGTILLNMITIVKVFSYIFLIIQKIKQQLLLQNIENVLFVIKWMSNLISNLLEYNIQCYKIIAVNY